MNTMLYLPQGFLFHENIGVTAAAVFIPEIWAMKTLENIYAKSAMIGAVSHDYQDEINKKGDVVHVQKRGVLASHEKLENQKVTLNAPTGTTMAVTLTNHKEVSFLVEDVAEAQATPSIIDGYTQDAAKVLAQDIELALCGVYGDEDYDEDNDLDWDSSDVFTSMLNLRTKMVVDAKLPESAPRYVVVRDSGVDFLNEDKFVSKDTLDQNSLGTGTVGRILGFGVKESSEIVHTVSPTLTHRLAFARDAITLVTRRLADPPQGSGAKGVTVSSDGVAVRAVFGYSMDYLGLQCTVDVLFGTKVLYPQWVYQLLDVAA